ncbi:BadF/BadG/BcrA/BcrD ATPase family protein [Pseudoalteromonas sp. BDTF-M6]|uniref:BadF/BadG/BcrA/BcrD ATPase family protein n=1 Tax=Pseudoalteromonas sp. BDTF-M6 TaxID=2796132 RepID=UPI001BAF7837|nr:BadF/BadG/BcrA/BcrD ATPase family protein [Pseudoalteromonas sp. BDTF-M6]MBS3798984.1 ATPase [Pseudoalteromonas sp. BDTF-M6]
MANWVLAIDGGGTKTALRLHNPDGRVVQEQRGPGSSLGHDLQLGCDTLCAQVASILHNAAILAPRVNCVAGVAGAGNPYNQAQLRSRLQALGLAGVKVVSDAITSAYGANLGAPVACIALGTGSVGTRLQADGSTHLVGGWGFTLGDEGGGARLGAMLVQALMQAFDRQQALTPLLEVLAQRVGHSREALSGWLSAAKVQDFARLSELVWPYQGRCDMASAILQRHTQAVEQLIRDTRGEYDLPVVLLGGLADNTAPLLAPRYQTLVQRARGSALDGAYLLALKNL